VPLAQPVFDLFSDEWNRFNAGLGQLGDIEGAQYYQAYRRRKANPDGHTTINIPGWSDVIHLEARYRPTREEKDEWYQARRQRRQPNLAPAVVAELERRDVVKRRMASTAQPDYIHSFGSIMTAIDNVQDFLSTVATGARLGLWGLGKVAQAVLPGASDATATALGAIARRQAEAAAARGFLESVTARAAAGELVAKLALNNPALFAAAERTAIREAGELAFKRAFSAAALGMGGRLIGRFVPIVGWVLLASDLLNLLSFLGMVATPAYALACRAPQEVLAAGLPLAVFKRALKAESWNLHSLNPFSKQAAAKRVLRAGGRLPSISNLVEVVQTTDQLFGVGASFGGLVGAMNDIAFGSFALQQGKTVPILWGGQALEVSAEARKKFAQQGLATQRLIMQAGDVALTAGAVWAVQEVFTEEEHLHTAIAYDQAIALLYWFWHDLPFHADIARITETPFEPPLSVDADTVAWAEQEGLDLEATRRWWLPGAPRAITGEQYVLHHTRAIPRAIRDFLRPRRNTAAGALFGAYVNQTTESLFMLLEDDRDFLRFELTDDAYLVSHLAESGFFLGPLAEEGPTWALWQRARALIADGHRRRLTAAHWRRWADELGVPLVTGLPPDAAVPAGWAPRSDEVPPAA
jgi:hypothetical protein